MRNHYSPIPSSSSAENSRSVGSILGLVPLAAGRVPSTACRPMVENGQRHARLVYRKYFRWSIRRESPNQQRRNARTTEMWLPWGGGGGGRLEGASGGQWLRATDTISVVLRRQNRCLRGNEMKPVNQNANREVEQFVRCPLHFGRCHFAITVYPMYQVIAE